MTKPLYCLKYSAMNDPALSADDVLVAFVDLQAGIVNLGINEHPGASARRGVGSRGSRCGVLASGRHLVRSYDERSGGAASAGNCAAAAGRKAARPLDGKRDGR